MSVELENTSEFANLLNKWNCWIRWECKTRSDNLICYIVKFVDYEWDMSVKLEKTSEFVKLLNMLGQLKEIWMWN